MIPIIISGGSGSRLWPVSRQADPKPFLKLSDGYSLLQNTFMRAAKLKNINSIVSVTNEKIHFRMQDEYQQINIAKLRCDFILEPFPRNTAPAIAAALSFIKNNYSNDETILILPADHLISDFRLFNQAVEQAQELANNGYLVTFGIKPEYPETGYGYIETDITQPLGNIAYKIKNFVEKPDHQTAISYLHTGNYLWNSGMFCARVDVFYQEMQKYTPNLIDTIDNCLTNSQCDNFGCNSIVHLNPDLFINAENISIDYALFEKSAKCVTIPCTLGWSDIGSWLSIAQTIPKDQTQNSLIGETILHNVHNCLIYSTNRIVAGVDINDLIIVDTPDAILVAHKNYAQDVKHIFERLKNMEHKTSELHRTVHRPWGTYTVLEENSKYKIKKIEVKPDAALSLQLHYQRSEHWIVVSGIATVINGDQLLELTANQSTYIEKGTKHRLENKTKQNLILIEVQCGSYLGEDDIVRFEDQYGRI